MTIYDAGGTTVVTGSLTSGAGDIDFNLNPGSEYSITVGGTFDSATIDPVFVDTENNEIPVPLAGEIDSVASPMQLTGNAVIRLIAATSILRFSFAAAGASVDVRIEIARIKA